MRHFFSTAAILFGLLTQPALAQPPEERGEGDRPGRPARERILRAFDKDGDGRLNAEEREAMRDQMGERFNRLREEMRDLFEDRRTGPPEGERRPDAERERRRETRDGEARDRDARRDRDRPRDADRARRDADRARRDPDRARRDPDRMRRGDRPRGPIGPVGGPRERNLDTLFGWFDLDGDNMLSRREFAELSQFVDRRRPGPPGGGPAGPRIGRRGFDGPPGRGGDRFDFRMRERRLEGPPRGDGPRPRDRDDRRARGDQRRRPDRPDNAPNRPRPQEARPNAADAI